MHLFLLKYKCKPWSWETLLKFQLIGLSILGFSIYAAVDSSSAIRLLSDNSSYFVEDHMGLSLGRIFFWVAVGFAILSFIVIVISITGIVGTLKVRRRRAGFSQKPMPMTHNCDFFSRVPSQLCWLTLSLYWYCWWPLLLELLWFTSKIFSFYIQSWKMDWKIIKMPGMQPNRRISLQQLGMIYKFRWDWGPDFLLVCRYPYNLAGILLQSGKREVIKIQ